MVKVDLKRMKDGTPWPYVPRAQFEEFSLGVYNEASMAVYDNQGKRPEGFFYLDRKACCQTDATIAWLEERSSDEKRTLKVGRFRHGKGGKDRSGEKA